MSGKRGKKKNKRERIKRGFGMGHVGQESIGGLG